MFLFGIVLPMIRIGDDANSVDIPLALVFLGVFIICLLVMDILIFIDCERRNMKEWQFKVILFWPYFAFKYAIEIRKAKTEKTLTRICPKCGIENTLSKNCFKCNTDLSNIVDTEIIKQPPRSVAMSWIIKILYFCNVLSIITFIVLLILNFI